MGHLLLPGLVAVAGGLSVLGSLLKLAHAWRHRGDTPLRDHLLSVGGSLCYGAGMWLALFGTSVRVQVVGLLLIVASAAQSVLWTRRARHPGPNGGAV